jgi:hypothetical protein
MKLERTAASVWEKHEKQYGILVKVLVIQIDVKVRSLNPKEEYWPVVVVVVDV